MTVTVTVTETESESESESEREIERERNKREEAQSPVRSSYLFNLRFPILLQFQEQRFWSCPFCRRSDERGHFRFPPPAVCRAHNRARRVALIANVSAFPRAFPTSAANTNTENCRPWSLMVSSVIAAVEFAAVFSNTGRAVW